MLIVLIKATNKNREKLNVTNSKKQSMKIDTISIVFFLIKFSQLFKNISLSIFMQKDSTISRHKLYWHKSKN